MTPKEKAQDLVAKIHQYIPLAQDDYGMDKIGYKKFNARECALIAANEVLNALFQHHEIDFWKQVKKEIENL